MATLSIVPLLWGKWTDLGAGPMRLGARGEVIYLVNDTEPATPYGAGFLVPLVGVPIALNSHVWAMPLNDDSPASAILSPLFDPAQPQPTYPVAPPSGEHLTHLTAAGGQALETSPGYLIDITINTTGSSGSLTLYDGLTAAGAVMAIIDISKQGSGLGNGTPWPFAAGLYVNLSAAADVTILSRAKTAQELALEEAYK